MNTITINEKEFKVNFSFKAIAQCEKTFNCSLSELSDHAQKVFNYPALLQIGINSITGQNITIEEIEMWLDGGDFERLKIVGEIIGAEIIAYFGVKTEKNA